MAEQGKRTVFAQLFGAAKLLCCCPLSFFFEPVLVLQYCQEFYRGQVKSKSGETWSFENGLLRGPICTFKWLGNVLRKADEEKADHGHGNYDGKILSWSFADMPGTFYEYTINADEKGFSCQKIGFGSVKWDIKLDGVNCEAVGGKLEGADDEFAVTGGKKSRAVHFLALID